MPDFDLRLPTIWLYLKNPQQQCFVPIVFILQKNILSAQNIVVIENIHLPLELNINLNTATVDTDNA